MILTAGRSGATLDATELQAELADVRSAIQKMDQSAEAGAKREEDDHDATNEAAGERA